MLGELILFIWVFLGGVLFLVTLPGTIELLLVTLGAYRFRYPDDSSAKQNSRLAVLIPAYNEELSIANTLKKLLACPGSFSTVVVADNCTDNTAEIARQCGVEVLVRKDELNKGKHYALLFGFLQLEQRDFTHYVILDADTEVAPNFIQAVAAALEQGAEAVQVRYGVLQPERSMRTRLMHIAFLAFNFLRPLGRAGWDLSCGILGNGFVVSKKILKKVPFTVSSIVEDLAYHIKLVKAGVRVWFVPETAVFGAMPVHSKAASVQRARWEGGRLRVLLDEFPGLFRGILQGRYRLFEPLLELLLLPSAYHILFLLVLLCIPWTFGRWYAGLALGIFAGYLLTALIKGKATWKDYTALLLVPFYLLWKIFLLIPIVKTAQQKASWERTPREKE